MTAPAQAIVNATSDAINPLPDISGCPTRVAEFAVAAALRAAAEELDKVGCVEASGRLEQWADDIDEASE